MSNIHFMTNTRSATTNAASDETAAPRFGFVRNENLALSGTIGRLGAASYFNNAT